MNKETPKVRWATYPQLQALLRGFPASAPPHSNRNYQWFLGGPIRKPEYRASWNFWIDRYRRRKAGMDLDPVF